VPLNFFGIRNDFNSPNTLHTCDNIVNYTGGDRLSKYLKIILGYIKWMLYDHLRQLTEK